MIRGTTAIFKFKLPYPKEEVAWATIEFWQSNNPSKLLPIVKNISHCYTDANPNELCVSLTAEETSRFSDKYKAKTQIRGMHVVSGAVFGCPPQTVTVYPMRDDIIENDPTLPSENDDGFIVLDGKNIVD